MFRSLLPNSVSNEHLFRYAPVIFAKLFDDCISVGTPQFKEWELMEKNSETLVQNPCVSIISESWHLQKYPEEPEAQQKVEKVPLFNGFMDALIKQQTTAIHRYTTDEVKINFQLHLQDTTEHLRRLSDSELQSLID